MIEINNDFIDKEICIIEIFKQHFGIDVDENFPQTQGDKNIIEYFEEGFKAGLNFKNKTIMNNPYQQENGLPIIGKENEFYDWEKEKFEKEFELLSPEQQKEIEESSKRFQKKTL